MQTKRTTCSYKRISCTSLSRILIKRLIAIYAINCLGQTHFDCRSHWVATRQLGLQLNRMPFLHPLWRKNPQEFTSFSVSLLPPISQMFPRRHQQTVKKNKRQSYYIKNSTKLLKLLKNVKPLKCIVFSLTAAWGKPEESLCWTAFSEGKCTALNSKVAQETEMTESCSSKGRGKNSDSRLTSLGKYSTRKDTENKHQELILSKKNLTKRSKYQHPFSS